VADTDSQGAVCVEIRDKPLAFDSNNEVDQAGSDLVGYGFSRGEAEMMKLGIAVLLAALSFCGTQAAEAKDFAKVLTYGVGQQSCGMWTQARKSGRTEELSMTSWAMGYISGASSFGGGDLRATDTAGIRSYLDTYCAAHPLDAFVIANTALAAELMPGKP
jgi:hypothetical protein